LSVRSSVCCPSKLGAQIDGCPSSAPTPGAKHKQYDKYLKHGIFCFMNRSPLKSFTRGIPEANERTPAFIAATEGNGIIPQTWGNVASALIERGITGTSSVAVCDFLGISAEMLRDPAIITRTAEDVEDLEYSLIDKWAKEYAQAHQKDEHPFREQLTEAKAQWQVEDNETKAQALQQQFDDLRQQERDIRASLSGDRREMFQKRIEATKDVRKQEDIVAMLEDAYSSGYVVSLDNFVETLFSVSCQVSFSEEELTSILHEVLDDFLRSHLGNAEDLPAREIIFGGREIQATEELMESSLYRRPREYGRARWESISDLFIAPRHDELPLFTGNER
jgi:hypothetical protein